MYTVQYSSFVNAFLVISNDTGIAQSSWKMRSDAVVCARDLNQAYRLGLTTEIRESLRLVVCNE